MNKNLLFALLVLPIGAPAQTSSPTSRPPALQPPANPSAWTVQYQDEKDESSNQRREPGAEAEARSAASTIPKITKIEFAIKGKVARSIATYSDGTTRTSFVFDSIGVQENPGDPTDIIINDFSSPWMTGGDFLRRYPGLEWVRPKFYRGVVQLGEVACHHFAEDAPAAPAPASDDDAMMPLPSEMLVGNREAWISMDGRPLATKQGTEIATYTYRPTGQVPTIEIPERFRAKATAFMNSLAPTNLR